jgi:hypothetical protein
MRQCLVNAFYSINDRTDCRGIRLDILNKSTLLLLHCNVSKVRLEYFNECTMFSDDLKDSSYLLIFNAWLLARELLLFIINKEI